MILRLAILVEHRLVTDRHKTMAYTALAWRRAVKRTDIRQFVNINHDAGRHVGNQYKRVCEEQLEVCNKLHCCTFTTKY